MKQAKKGISNKHRKCGLFCSYLRLIAIGGEKAFQFHLSYFCKSGLARDSLKLFYSADRLAIRGTVYLANGRERIPTLSKEKV